LVRDVVFERIPYTLLLVGGANFILFFLSLWLAMLLSKNQGKSPKDKLKLRFFVAYNSRLQKLGKSFSMSGKYIFCRFIIIQILAPKRNYPIDIDFHPQFFI